MNGGLAQIGVTGNCSYPLFCANPPFICAICVKRSPIGRDIDEPSHKRIADR